MKRAQAAEDAGKPVVLLDSDQSGDNLSSDDDEAFQEKNIGMYQKSGHCHSDFKSFVPQVVCLAMVALWFSAKKLGLEDMSYERKKKIIQKRKDLVEDIGHLGLRMKHSLQASSLEKYKEVAKFLKDQDNVFLLSKGRGVFVSEFAAYKFNQIAEIHAEAYSSAEFRHGPLAMLNEEEKTAVIFLLLDDETLSQTLHNVNQVKDRGSTVIVITNVADIES